MFHVCIQREFTRYDTIRSDQKYNEYGRKIYMYHERKRQFVMRLCTTEHAVRFHQLTTIVATVPLDNFTVKDSVHRFSPRFCQHAPV